MNKNKTGISPIVIVVIILVILVIVGVVMTISNKNKENVSQESDTNISQNQNTSEEQEETKTESNDFLMEIDDVFYIEGTGTVVTGTVKSGKIYIGNEVEIVGMGRERRTVEVSLIEHMRDKWAFAQKGDSVGIALKDVGRDDVERGQVLAKPDTITTYTEFEAEIEMLLEEQMKKDFNKKEIYFVDGQTTDFDVGSVNIKGVISISNNKEIKAGDKAKIHVKLEKDVYLEKGQQFDIKELGGYSGNQITTAAKGKITKVIEE